MYPLLFASLTFVVMCLTLVTLAILDIAADKRFGADSKIAKRFTKGSVVLMVPVLSLGAPYTAAWTLASFAGLYPPLPQRDSSAVQPQALGGLEKQIEELQSQLAAPKQLTIAEIENLLEETLSTATRVAPALIRQKNEIERLRQAVEQQTKAADEARRLAEQAQSLTRAQLETVKLIVTEDASQASRRSFIFGVALSFPIGLLTSILGQMVWSRLRPTRRPIGPGRRP